MPLTPSAARALREVREPPLHADETERRYARALAWLGHRVALQLRMGQTVTGTVEGVAALPHVRLQAMDSGVILLRRGGPDVDVLEGYVMGTVAGIVEAGEHQPTADGDRRDRYV